MTITTFNVFLNNNVYIWCDFDCALSLICGNKMPTRCNRGFYCRSYCPLNMFRAPLCPSSGAQGHYTVVAARGIWSCGFQVAGLVWSWVKVINVLKSGAWNPVRQFAVATKFCAVVPKICGPSVENLLYVILLAPRILKWFKSCGKFVHSRRKYFGKFYFVFVPKELHFYFTRFRQKFGFSR